MDLRNLGRVWLLVGLSAVALQLSFAQQKHFVGIKDVAAAGSVSNGRYTNSFLKLSIEAPDATVQINPTVEPNAQRGRLVQILAKPTSWEKTYTFGLIADLLAVNPLSNTPSDYVKEYCEHLRLPIVRTGIETTVSGVGFSGAILEEQTPSGSKYYRGIYSTFRNGYIVTFDVEGSSEANVGELLPKLVRLEK